MITKPNIGEKGLFLGVNPPLTIISSLIVTLFILFTIGDTELAGDVFSDTQKWIQSTLDWYYVLSVNIFLLFTFYLAFSKYGQIRLGGDSEKPEFSYFSWFSMLFGAGMGIGVLFWSVAEPIYHFQSNPLILPEEVGTAAAADKAIQFVMLHWGLHGWACFAVVALSLCYFAYRRGMPLSLRSTLYPIFGERVNGGIGIAIDTLAIFATLFGLCTTLGAGAGQINAGMNYLFGLPENLANQIIIVVVISTFAMISVMSGLQRGIKLLSQTNVWLSMVIFLVVLIAGPTGFLLGFTLTNLGEYATHFIPTGFWVDPNPEGSWQGDWTIFYWGWWIAWGPFVGMFIARISRGRTIKEFCLGVLLVPTLVCVVWFGVFGGTSLHMAMFDRPDLIDVVNDSISRPIFFIIENLGLGGLTKLVAFLALTLIISYFVTSSDSGTLMIATLISIGDAEPNPYYRLFWGCAQGLAAIALLLAGGLEALKTAPLVAGLPFSIIIYLMIYTLLRGLMEEMPGTQPLPAKT